jgi:hypothetical protein
MLPGFRSVSAALVVSALLLAPSLAAQNVLRVPGKTVEVIGLERWTVPMLQDSLRRYGGGVTLDSDACAGVLRENMGFPAAAVTTFHVAGRDEYVAVSVVEPASRARVRRRNVGGDTVALRAGWETAGTIIRRTPRALHGALLGDRTRTIPPFAAADSAEIRTLWAFMDAQRTPAGYAAAVDVLATDPTVYDRLLAGVVLQSAPAEDAILHALVRAMLDDSDHVAQMASRALERLAKDRQGIDWAPVAGELHALLDGSNLFELEETMSALVESGVDGRWAAPLLAGGGHAVLARMEAESPLMWRPAHRLLVALRGEDLGRDPAAWRAWIASLRG